MKVFFAFCFFFGSILLVLALVVLCLFLAPAEYILDQSATEISAGTFRHPERIFPNLPVKSRYSYPGIQADLMAKGSDTTAHVMAFPNKEQAKPLFKAYAEKYLQGILSQSSGIGYYNYKKKASGVVGRIKLLEGVIIHVEGKDYPLVDQAIERSTLMVRNPEANIFTDIARTDKYVPHIMIFVLLYFLVLIPLWFRVASWAATVVPKQGIEPVRESDLRKTPGCFHKSV
jgi:hypothetical protein